MFAVRELNLKLQQQFILTAIDFTFATPGVLSIIGPSGAGKSSLLRCVAGLEKYQGEIIIDDKPLDALPPGQRQIGYVEQQNTLFPHLTLTENISYPLQLRHHSKTEINQRVATLLQRCAITHCAQRLPHQVSGGEQRRAMLARALIYEPKIVLLDEPFSAVDALTRVELVRWLKTELQQRQITALYVTHDIPEAKFISQQAIILHQGKLLAHDTWDTLAAYSPFIQKLLQTHFGT